MLTQAWSKKIKKIIKQIARLVLKLWPETSSLLEDSTADPTPTQDEAIKELPDKETENSK